VVEEEEMEEAVEEEMEGVEVEEEMDEVEEVGVEREGGRKAGRQGGRREREMKEGEGEEK
jgi:hypothetical protein